MAKQSAQMMEATNEKIIQVAMELFLSKGIANTTMQQIADRVGISHRTLYRYFKDKDTLACTIAVIKRGELEDIRHAALRMEGTGYQRIKEHVAFLTHYQCLLSTLRTSRFLAEYNYYSVILTSGLQNDGLATLNVEYQALIEDMLRSGQADGSIRGDIDPVVSAGMFIQVYIQMVHQMAALYCGDGTQDPPDNRYVRTFLEHYLLAVQAL